MQVPSSAVPLAVQRLRSVGLLVRGLSREQPAIWSRTASMGRLVLQGWLLTLLSELWEGRC